MAHEKEIIGTIKRRRFITLCLATSSASLLSLPSFAKQDTIKPYYWTGYGMGAEISMTLYHQNAEMLVHTIHEKVTALENIFSLYNEHSHIRILNDTGILENPNPLFVTLLRQSKDLYVKTGGAFNITVQPLWELYQSSFSIYNKPPSDTAILDTVQKCDMNNLVITDTKISLKNKAKITLNGIAQGFVTDYIADYLAASGLKSGLINMGEYRAIGYKENKNNALWHLKIPTETDFKVTALKPMQALSTSSPYATMWNRTHHHLFDSQTGHSANITKPISVIASTATLADALSTALSVANKTQFTQIKKNFSDIHVA